ncbi:MAG: hypothetical protein K2X52_28600 [Mycobacteriaceae bacterium]|nr:hypothetical protein [Mycobacteriaceae bacterium]
MAQVFPDTVKLYYEESKAARAQIESLLDKYRSNTSTLLTLATAAVAFFGFSTGPRQPVFYWLAIGCYLLAVATSFLIFVPIPMRMNVAHDTAEELFVPPPITPAKMYYDYARGHQDAIAHAQTIVGSRFGIATRFRVLIAAIGLLIVTASLSVIFGAQHALQPTHIIIDRSSS